MNYREVFVATIQAVALFIAGFVIPVLGQMVALLTPVPLILVSVRNGILQGYLALIGSGVIIGVAAGWQAAAALVLIFGMMGIGISEGMRRQWKTESVVLLGGILPVMAIAVFTISFFTQISKSPTLVVEEYLKDTVAEAAKMYTQLGLKEMAGIVSSVSDRFIHYLVRLIPGIMIATTVFQAVVCYAVSRRLVLKKPGMAPPIRSTTLAQWHAPDVWVWGLIVGLGLSVLPNDTAQFTGWNLAIIYVVVYLTQGIAIVDHYLRKARIQPFLRGLLHSLILALPSIVFVIALGIVDIWADFRKVRVQERSA
jgi:hypothetical protein